MELLKLCLSNFVVRAGCLGEYHSYEWFRHEVYWLECCMTCISQPETVCAFRKVDNQPEATSNWVFFTECSDKACPSSQFWPPAEKKYGNQYKTDIADRFFEPKKKPLPNNISRTTIGNVFIKSWTSKLPMQSKMQTKDDLQIISNVFLWSANAKSENSSCYGLRSNKSINASRYLTICLF